MDARVPIPVEHIEHNIYLIRGQKVMLDSDLAGLYGVETKQMNRALRRNVERFPADFRVDEGTLFTKDTNLIIVPGQHDILAFQYRQSP